MKVCISNGFGLNFSTNFSLHTTYQILPATKSKIVSSCQIFKEQDPDATCASAGHAAYQDAISLVTHHQPHQSGLSRNPFDPYNIDPRYFLYSPIDFPMPKMEQTSEKKVELVTKTLKITAPIEAWNFRLAFLPPSKPQKKKLKNLYNKNRPVWRNHTPVFVGQF